MGKFIGGSILTLLGAGGAAALICFAVITSSIFGALGGYLVDHTWVFDGEVAKTLTVYGLPFVPLWKVGATLGFLSSTLPKLAKTTVANTGNI